MIINEKKLRKIVNIFEELRGIDVTSCFTEQDTVMVYFNSACRSSLVDMAHCGDKFYSAGIEIVPDEKDILYLFHIDTKVIDKFANDLKQKSSLKEDFQEIENFNKLDKGAQDKFLAYVKSIRYLYPNGAEWLSAKEVLDENRRCEGCGDDLYSSQAQMQAILEWDNPLNTYKALENIYCDKEHEDD